MCQTTFFPRRAPGCAISGRVALLLLLCFSAGGGSLLALDITFEGRTHRAVEVVAVEGDLVILQSKRGEITVSRKSLTWQLEAEVKKFESAGGADAGRTPLPQNEVARAWIFGPVATERDGGITVASSKYFIRETVSRSGTVRDPSMEKNGAPVYTGTVFVRAGTQKAESKFDRVLWRAGFVVVDGLPMPAFSSRDPGPVAIPDLTGEQVWTNAENKELTATLKSVSDGKGYFVRADGTKFTYDLKNLSEENQTLIKDAVEKRAKLIEQLKRANPGQKLTVA